MMNLAIELMQRASRGLAAHLAADGELWDPVFAEPTQYGTAYYAYVNAALATTPGASSAQASLHGLEATFRHLLFDPSSPAPVTRFYPAVGSPTYSNLRDFMWPPALRAVRRLAQLGVDVSALRQRIAEVAVPEAFQMRPPINWASVWMVGEQLRMKEGLSPYAETQLDRWLEPFFEERIDVERGLYREPGLPNSYDLFTRAHLAYLLDEGYSGGYAAPLRRLLRTGLRRSLAVQLVDGSLGSAHRSTGQTWTLGAQISYFHLAAKHVEQDDPALAAVARAAAARAFEALARCFRAAGDLSPAQNVFPPSDRIGYEVYTSDPHYVALPLGFLATAVLDGYVPGDSSAIDRRAQTWVDGAPLHRALVHRDSWSVHVNLNPQDGYGTSTHRFDAFGVADVVLGPERGLRFGGQVHHVGTDTPLTVGLAVRDDERALEPLSTQRPVSPPELRAIERGLEGRAQLPVGAYALSVQVAGDSAIFSERLDGAEVSLLVPYLKDAGDGRATSVELHRQGATLSFGQERIDVAVLSRVRRVVHLTHGHESRHGLVGLLRFDLEDAGEARYQIRRVR